MFVPASGVPTQTQHAKHEDLIPQYWPLPARARVLRLAGEAVGAVVCDTVRRSPVDGPNPSPTHSAPPSLPSSHALPYPQHTHRQDLQKQREMARRPDCGRKPACAPRATGLSASAATSPQLLATHSGAADHCAVSGCCCCCSSSAAAAAPLRLPSAHRSRIVGWMRHVAEALGLHLATLFAAGSLLDRFIAASEVGSEAGWGRGRARAVGLLATVPGGQQYGTVQGQRTGFRRRVRVPGRGSFVSFLVQGLRLTHCLALCAWHRAAHRPSHLISCCVPPCPPALQPTTATRQDLPPDSMLQLLAIACMSVAVKYEEVGGCQIHTRRRHIEAVPAGRLRGLPGKRKHARPLPASVCSCDIHKMFFGTAVPSLY
mgnify:CR=1 FL=1